MIKVKAFGGSARGAQIPLEESQVQADCEGSEHFYLYVVDQVAARRRGARACPGTARRSPRRHAQPRQAGQDVVGRARLVRVGYVD